MSSAPEAPAGTFAIIPCTGAKNPGRLPAEQKYAGASFGACLAAAKATGLPVLILSARYGLVELDAEIDDYEQRMDEEGRIGEANLTAQLAALGATDLYCFLPRAYFEALDAAARPLLAYAFDLYEGDGRGIGEHRRVQRSVRESYAAA